MTAHSEHYHRSGIGRQHEGFAADQGFCRFPLYCQESLHDPYRPRFLGVDNRTLRCWEKCKALPQRPSEILAKIDGAVQPIKPPTPKKLNTFGKRLRKWRKAGGLNQRQACELLGVTVDQGKLCKWERGIWVPREPDRSRMLTIIRKPLPVPVRLRFATILREWRKRRRLRQIDACAVLGVVLDGGRISKWERRVGRPDEPELARLLAIIGEDAP